MKKLIIILAVMLLALATAGVAAAAGEGLPHTGRVIVVTGGEIQVPPGDQADVVVAINAHADVAGSVNTLVVIDGTADVAGATVESMVAVNAAVDLSGTTTVLGDVLELESTLSGVDAAEVGGSVRNLAGDVVAFGMFMGAAAIVLWIGVGVATLLFGLLVAGVAARQVRAATGLISREPVTVGLVGLLAVVLPPIVAILAMVTLIGIPSGFALLVLVWPAAAFIGYVVAAIWLGSWLLGRTRAPDAAVPERPYAASLIGLVVAFVLGLVPLVSAILSIFGLGAVVLATWRTLRGTGMPAALQPSPAPAA